MYHREVLFDDAFRAMDTGIDVEIEAETRPHGAFVSIRLLFEQQEQRFSRFREKSLLSRLNAGDAVDDPVFVEGCRLAIAACEFTGGLFNPMVLPALRRAGYDRTFSQVSGGNPVAGEAAPSPVRALRFEGDSVRLIEGQLDLGGIVKGWTADLAATVFPEFSGVLVNAGGDVRTTGRGDGEGGWLLSIENPAGGPPVWEGTLAGACATSTTLKRRWRAADGRAAHHLIDPRTGLPSESPFVQVSVWAPEAWRAEAWAKAVLIAGKDGAEAAQEAGHTVLTLSPDGLTRFWD